MAEDMSTSEFRIAFDGEALASHTMDVRDLAPSLLALGEIVAEANRVLNGSDAKAELHVTPNIHEGCFDIGIEIKQQWETLKTLLGDDDISTAKNLVEWIFIGGTSIGGLLLLYKNFGPRKPINIVQFNDEYGNRMYRYQFAGAEDQIMDEKLHRLFQNNRIRRLLSRLLAPVLKREGITSFVAYVKEKASGLTVSKADAKGMDFSIPEPDEIIPDTDEPFEAVLRVYSPVYDSKANRWRFWYGNSHHYMDVSESNIRRVVLENGGALVDDRFKVKLQVTKVEGEDGKEVPHFKVLDVIEFVPASRQPDLFLQHVASSQISED